MSRSTVKLKEQPAHFTPITEPVEIRRLLGQASDSAARVEISWASEGQDDRKLTGKVLDDANETSGITIKLSAPPKSDSHARPDPLALIFIPGMLVLGVKPAAIQPEPKCWRLLPPFKFFRLQRRNDVRYVIPRGYDYMAWVDSFEAGRKKQPRKILDISISGLGFHLLSQREAANCPVGMMLKGIRIEIENRELTVDGQVMNHIPLAEIQPELGGLKIGVKFIKMSPEDQEFLVGFIARGLAHRVPS